MYIFESVQVMISSYYGIKMKKSDDRARVS
jgi:hypothetical protein